MKAKRIHPGITRREGTYGPSYTVNVNVHINGIRHRITRSFGPQTCHNMPETDLDRIASYFSFIARATLKACSNSREVAAVTRQLMNDPIQTFNRNI